MKFACILLVLLVGPVLGQTPASLERSMLKDLNDISKYGSYSGGYDEEKNNAANRRLKETLIKNGTRADVLRYAFPKLNAGDMFIATSKDGRLRVYSWDLNTGGTLHDFDNVYQYQGASGKVYTWSSSDEHDGGGSFVTEISQISGKNGPVYLAASTFIGSTSYAGQSIQTIVIDGEKLDTTAKLIKTGRGLQNTINFGYDFFSVVDHPERPVKLIFFDPVKQTFRFPVVIEDEKTPQGRVTSKFITYKFNGEYFVKVG